MKAQGQGRVEGKVAVVTGAASGIGAATARLLAHEGSTVLLADIDADARERVTDDINASGGCAEAAQVDIADEDSVAALTRSIEQSYGSVDILYNCAAITDPEHQRRDRTVTTMDVATWDQSFRVDLTGTMLMCKHVLPLMIPAGNGSIINTSSGSSFAGDLSLTAYSAAKAGVNSLTLSIATAFGKKGIRCNAISPSCIRSPSLERNISPEVIRIMEGSVLLPELGLPEDVARAVLFLASEDSSFITGQILRIDGGALSKLPHVQGVEEAGRTTV